MRFQTHWLCIYARPITYYYLNNNYDIIIILYCVSQPLKIHIYRACDLCIPSYKYLWLAPSRGHREPGGGASKIGNNVLGFQETVSKIRLEIV